MFRITREALVAAAGDLNTTLDLDPAIDTSKTEAELKTQIIEASTLLREGDKIADDTRKIIEACDRRNGAEESAPAKAKTASAAKPKKAQSDATAAAKAKPEKTGRVRSTTTLGQFSPIRAGSRIHTFVKLASEGKTVAQIAKSHGNPDHGETGIRWWLKQYLRRHHGIGTEIDAAGKVSFVLPEGKTLDDCVVVKKDKPKVGKTKATVGVKEPPAPKKTPAAAKKPASAKKSVAAKKSK